MGDFEQKHVEIVDDPVGAKPLQPRQPKKARQITQVGASGNSRRCRFVACRIGHLRELGYSVTEAAVALSLVGILVAAGVAGFRPAYAREQVDAWALSTTFDISTARQTAVTERTPVTVTLTDSSYLIAAGVGTTLRSAVLPSDISIATTCPSRVCAFDRRGLPTAAGTITLTSSSTGRSYVITIEPSTGSVSYQ